MTYQKKQLIIEQNLPLYLPFYPGYQTIFILERVLYPGYSHLEISESFVIYFLAFPKKLRHEEDDPVLTNEIKVEEPMKRKIAASSSAPTYKGEIHEV